MPELAVSNAGLLPLLLVEGENLLGGWQNRTLNVSVLLAAGAGAGITAGALVWDDVCVHLALHLAA